MKLFRHSTNPVLTHYRLVYDLAQAAINHSWLPLQHHTAGAMVVHGEVGGGCGYPRLVGRRAQHSTVVGGQQAGVLHGVCGTVQVKVCAEMDWVAT